MKISINANRCEPSPMRKFHPLAVKVKKSGAKIYHLNIGQPDIATPNEFYDAIKNYFNSKLIYRDTGLTNIRTNGEHAANDEMIAFIISKTGIIRSELKTI